MSDWLRERRPGAVRASWAGPGLARVLLISLLAGLVLAVLGPFGSSAAPLALRLFYWIGVVVLGSLLGWTTAWLFCLWGGLKDRPWLETAATAVAMTPPGAVLAWGLSALAFGADAPFMSPLGYLVPVLVISLALSAVNRLAAPRPPVEIAAPPRFLARLPLPLRAAELYALEAEDHYLRVRTSRGSELILCRMADAVAELEAVEGLRTHRSWWVAKAAVEKVARADGRAALTLKDGTEAPVSRASMPLLREKGWL